MLARSWRLWKEVDPFLSFSGYLYAAYGVATGAAGVIAWATTYWAWYWQTFSWAGVGFAFLAAWLVFALGIFLIGVGVWIMRKLAHPAGAPAIRSKELEKQLETTPRRVSGLEVVQRLEKLEKERADTNAGELASGLGATMKVTGTVIPAAKYSKTQINKIVEAIDAVYPPVRDIETILKFGQGIAASLEAIIRDTGAAAFLAHMDEMRLRLNDASGDLNKATEKYSLYTEVSRVVEYQKQMNEQFFTSYNELAGILREIPDKMSTPALKNYVDAKKSTFVSRIDEYLKWTEQKKKALSDYREFYLRRPTTD
jgi:hypothetical protein